ncbi:MAG: transglycosylase domain-containing protein, partial [Chromatiaceae bacterium]
MNLKGPPGPRRWLLIALGIGCLAGLAALASLPFLVNALEPRLGAVPTSPLVLDRHGRLLRAFTVADGRWRLPVTLAEVDPLFIRMLLACEDRRFHDHGGVDILALARAAGQWAANGRIVSGASTLTMQVARLQEGQPTRGLAGKTRQMVAALALERRLDKAAILERYLLLAPYGGNLEGLRAATLAWFGKEPGRLTPAQAALLVALPQAPEARRPDRDPAAAERARDRVLG